VPLIVGLIVGIGFVVGTVVSRQTFFTFVVENTRHFGVPQAMGTNARARWAHHLSTGAPPAPPGVDPFLTCAGAAASLSVVECLCVTRR